MTDTLTAYAAWLRSWASARTVQARVKVVRGRLAEWGDDPAAVTAEQIQAWLARDDLKRWTRQTYYATLVDFFAWCEATQRVATSPMALVRRPSAAKSSPRPLSQAEERLALAKATGHVRAWLLLALRAGLRAHEIAKIRGDDVTAEGIYVEGKGGTRATLPCHADIWALAQQYPRHGYWFPGYRGRAHIQADTVTNGVGRLFRSLGIEGSVHRARHAYATSLLRRGVNIRVVQRLMRHASLATTATYTAVDEDEMRAAVDLLGEAS